MTPSFVIEAGSPCCCSSRRRFRRLSEFDRFARPRRVEGCRDQGHCLKVVFTRRLCGPLTFQGLQEVIDTRYHAGIHDKVIYIGPFEIQRGQRWECAPSLVVTRIRELDAGSARPLSPLANMQLAGKQLRPKQFSA